MNFTQTLLISLQSLRRNQLRSALTVPGIVIARNAQVAQGDFISASNVTARSLVGVLGNTTATTLFGDPGSAVGQTIRVSGTPIKIIGVLVAKGGSGFGNQDDEIIVPITTA